MAIVAMNGHRKMTKAINLLNEAVKDKKQEIEENLEQLKKNAQRALEDTKENIVDAATEVDKSAHSNPWAYIGGAAAFALIAGFVAGRHTKK